MSIDLGRKFKYHVYGRNSQYLGTLPSVETLPKFNTQINNLLAKMKVVVLQSDSDGAVSFFDYITQGGDKLKTQDNNQLVGSEIGQGLLGTGGIIDNHNFVEVVAVNTGSHVQHRVKQVLEDEHGQPITTDTGEEIDITKGGRPVYVGNETAEDVLFRGYIVEDQLQADQSKITAEIYSHSHFMADLTLQEADTDIISIVGSNDGVPGNIIEIVQGQTIGVVQRFAITSSTRLDSIGLLLGFDPAKYNSDSIRISTDLFIGTTNPSSINNISSIHQVSANHYIQSAPARYFYHFQQPPTLSPGIYYLSIRSNIDLDFRIYESSDNYNIGGIWTHTASSGTHQGASNLSLRLTKQNFNTNLQFVNKRPSAILETVLDYAASRNSFVSKGTITDTGSGSEVNLNLKNVTITAAIAKIIAACPAGFYTYHDFGTGETHLLKAPAATDEADRLIKPKSHLINKGHIGRTSKYLVKRVLFFGGEVSGQTVYFIFENPNAPIGGREVKHFDNRVTQKSTAQKIANRIFAENSTPTMAGRLYILDNDDFSAYEPRVGEVWEFASSGNYSNNWRSQVMRKGFKGFEASAEMGYLKPQVVTGIDQRRQSISDLADINTPDTAQV